MKAQLQGLIYKYVQEQGKYLIFEQESGLSYHHLGKLQVQMMINNNIPRVLPLEIEEKDLILRLRYTMGTKRALTHWLKGNTLTQKSFLYMLLRVVQTIIDSQDFMLPERGFVISSDFIFVEDDVSDLCLLYLPLKEHKDVLTAENQCRTLALSLIPYIDELNGEVIQELMRRLQGEISLLELKDALQTCLKQMAYLNGPQSNERLGHKDNQGEPQFEQQVQQHNAEDKVRVHPSSNKQNPPRSVSIKPQVHQPFQREGNPFAKRAFKQWPEVNQGKGINQKHNNHAHPKDTSVYSQLPALSSRGKTYLFLMCLILTALVWKGYELFPSEGMLYLSIGSTILIWNGGFIFHSIWRPQALLRGARMSAASPDVEQKETSGQPQDSISAQSGSSPLKRQSFAKKSKANEKANNKANSLSQQSAKHVDQGPEKGNQPGLQHLRENHSVRDQKLHDQTNEAQASLDQYYAQLPQQTKILHASARREEDPTVALDQHRGVNALGASVDSTYTLIKASQSGQQERITIQHTPFVIGRNEGKVDFVDSEAGVSRAHFECVQLGEGLFIRDLDSKNGTMLNGEKITPNELLRVTEGDVIKIALSQYTITTEAHMRESQSAL
ncbi:DUF6382 domain-containing protein [Caldalkalibacillus salinus]|uniref:DUF6382 domain-containing protein n=1 Tax=Caldalkalibacillus salinus TaxID=2803787 RepID=UPI001923B12E|nr:DUF6382 domain-containing protein [Caldalkalibacillus salinus]